MKKINKNTMNFLLVGTIITVMLSLFISAFSVGFSSSINIEPTETVQKDFGIMNTADGAKDLTVEVSIEEGSEYVSLPDGNTYTVLAGEVIGVKALFNVPDSAQDGDVYKAKINFLAIEGGSLGGGTLSYKIGHTINFDINVMDTVPTKSETTPQNQTPPPVVTPQTTEGGSNVWLWVLAIAIIIVIVWIILKKKK